MAESLRSFTENIRFLFESIRSSEPMLSHTKTESKRSLGRSWMRKLYDHSEIHTKKLPDLVTFPKMHPHPTQTSNTFSWRSYSFRLIIIKEWVFLIVSKSKDRILSVRIVDDDCRMSLINRIRWVYFSIYFQHNNRIDSKL